MCDGDSQSGRTVVVRTAPGAAPRIIRRTLGGPHTAALPVLDHAALEVQAQELLELLEEPVRSLVGERLVSWSVTTESRWSTAAGTDGSVRRRLDLLALGEFVVREGGTRRRVLWQWSGPRALERLRHDSTALLREVEAALTAPALVEEVTCPVVLEPSTALHLVHETLGHTLEADNYDAYARELGFVAGRRLASAPLTVWDDPTDPGLVSGYEHDDEGTPAVATRLLHRGVVDGTLTDAAHARRLGLPLTGNGRRAVGATGILPRMSALRVERGQEALDALISRVESGLILRGSWGGGSSEEQFLVRPAYGEWISDGEPTGRFVRRLDLRGVKTEALAALEGISSETTVFNPITGCDKGAQTIPVSMTSPGLSLRTARLVPVR